MGFEMVTETEIQLPAGVIASRRSTQKFVDEICSECDVTVRLDKRSGRARVTGTEAAIDDVRRELADFNNVRKTLSQIVWVELMRTRTCDTDSVRSISGIQSRTGARIHIDRSKCELRLFGSLDQVGNASAMIDEMADCCKKDFFVMECSKTFSPEVLQDVAERYGIAMARENSRLSLLGVADAVGQAMHHLQILARDRRPCESEANFAGFPTLVFPASPNARPVKVLPQEAPARAGTKEKPCGRSQILQKLKKEKFCADCGHSLELAAQFCTECGVRVAQPMPAGGEQPCAKTGIVHAARMNSKTVGFVSNAPVYFMPGMMQQPCMFACAPAAQHGQTTALGFSGFQYSPLPVMCVAQQVCGFEEGSTCCGSSVGNPTLDSLPPM